jgi:D-alanyl-D-alanine carboxypeptidase
MGRFLDVCMSKARQTLWFHRTGALTVLAALLALSACDDFKRHPPASPPPVHPAAAPVATAALSGPYAAPETLPETFTAAPPSCALGPAQAAVLNTQSLRTLAWAPFHRPEVGWEVYAPLIAEQIGAACDPATPGFAADLAHWQGAHGLTADGVMSADTVAVMKALWEGRRPFVVASRHGCPPPADEASLATIPAEDSYGGKVMRLRPGALAAYQRLLAAARAETPALAADRQALRIYSAYRNPLDDAARCLTDGNCQGIVRTTCSAHDTGLAIDINLGAAPGFGPDSSDDANRLFISRTSAYRWMVRRAAAFGFVNYPFEPWHWEWTGEAVAPG